MLKQLKQSNMNKKRATTRLISSENEIESSVLKTGTEEEFNKAVIANTTPQSIYFRLLKAKQQIGSVSKNAKNPHFKNNYADINALTKEVEPILLEHGLLMMQPIIEGYVNTVIMDADTGESVSSSMKLPDIQDPQKIGSAITYYRRYTLQSLLCLQTEDDDAQSVSTHVKNTKPSIDQARFEKALTAIQEGKTSVDYLRTNFSLTELQEAALKLM